eukprot:TRINITY_DN2252_c0_g2_i3.p2 TRINITY_DN2252_c0_g2~~TRINITY_DN2252_c0_g2_i3.p2  ORF type:complete len:324 (+),score=85.42 TRINITY_DN2252_c0_g2_i3:101-973(+)
MAASQAALIEDAAAVMRRPVAAPRASTLQRVAGLAGVAAAVFTLARIAAPRTFVAPGAGAGGARGGVEMHLSGGSLQTVLPSEPAAADTSSTSIFRSVAGAAAMLLLAAGRKSSSSSSSKVAMQARSPFPSVPSKPMDNRRVANNGAAFYGKRQIAVRVNKNTNKPIFYRMHVKAGDVVQVCKGKDKGKVSTVLRVFRKWNRVLCLGVNYCIKHVRPQREDEVGQRVQVEAPMHSSNVMHYSEEQGVAGYLGIRYVEEDGKIVKQRYNKATSETIPRRKAPEWVPVLERE